MKYLTLPLLAVLLSACTTTTTKNPDGSTTTVQSQDPKTVQALANDLAPIIQSGIDAAVQKAATK